MARIHSVGMIVSDFRNSANIPVVRPSASAFTDWSCAECLNRALSICRSLSAGSNLSGEMLCHESRNMVTLVGEKNIDIGSKLVGAVE